MKNIIIYLIALSFFIISIIFLYIFPCQRPFIMNCIQSFSFVFAGFSVIISLQNRNDDSLLNKSSRSFDIITRWDSESLLKARSYSREVKKNKPNLSDVDLYKEINTKEGLEESVILLHNFGDQIRVGLKNSLLNEEVIFTILPAMKDILERFKPFFEEKYKGESDLYMKDYNKTIKCFGEIIEKFS